MSEEVIATKQSIQKILKMMQGTQIETISITQGTHKLKIKQPFAPATKVEEKKIEDRVATDVEKSEPNNLSMISSKNIGLFHLDSKIKAGAVLELGQLIGSITAMGIKNEIKSELSGKVHAVMAENNQAVDYNHPLIQVAI